MLNNPTIELMASWYEKHPELIYHEFKNTVGNLTLLEKPINIVAGNNFYEDKIDLRGTGLSASQIYYGTNANGDVILSDTSDLSGNIITLVGIKNTTVLSVDDFIFG